MSSTQWYVIRVIPGHEIKSKDYIQDLVERNHLQGYVDDLKVPEGEDEELTYPGYLFAKIELIEPVKKTILSVPGVMGFVSKGDRLVPLRQAEADKIIHGKKAHHSKKNSPFETGQSVKVMSGPFNGFKGTVLKVDEAHKKVTVEVTIFGRKTPTELNWFDAERMDPNPPSHDQLYKAGESVLILDGDYKYSNGKILKVDPRDGTLTIQVQTFTGDEIAIELKTSQVRYF